jgi:hypothetical protein
MEGIELVSVSAAQGSEREKTLQPARGREG